MAATPSGEVVSPLCIALAIVAFFVGMGSTIVIVSACAVSGSWAQAEESVQSEVDRE